MIPSSIIRALSHALTYFPPGLFSSRLFGGKSLFCDLWNSIGVDNNFRCKVLFSAEGNSRLFYIFPFQWLFLVLFLEKCICWKFPLTGFTSLLFGDLCHVKHGVFLFLDVKIRSVTSLFSFRTTYIDIWFGGTEQFNVVQSDK